MKETPTILRPREKLIKYGPNKLSDEELLAIILKTGTKNKNVSLLAREVLRKVGSNNISTVTINELKKIKGLGPVKAAEIVATFELGRRFLKDKKATLILSAEDVFREMADLRGNKKEHFVVFYLDTQNQEIKRDIVSIGTLNESITHPREVFEPAIKHLCSQIIVAHNHPSGGLLPSEQDKKVTRRLREAGDILGIRLLDHVIVTREGYYSFEESGLL